MSIRDLEQLDILLRHFHEDHAYANNKSAIRVAGVRADVEAVIEHLQGKR